MPFRPSPQHRQNIRGVIYPLTEAIRRLYGTRASDGAIPIGAFYTVKVSPRSWRPAGGVWYQPRSEGIFTDRAPNNQSVELFAASIQNGDIITLPSGVLVDWETIPHGEAAQLPAIRV